MNFRLRYEVPQWIMLAAMFLASGIIWPSTPDRVPVHWNAAGEVDRYGGKLEGLFLLPLISVGLYLLLLFLPRIDPGKASYVHFSGAYAAMRIGTTALMAGIHALVLLWIKDIKPNATLIVMLGVGLLFVLLGLVMGKIQPNWFVGIRTPWTLSSRRSWTRTHRLGGWLFIATGLLMMIGGLLPPTWLVPLILGPTILMSLVLIVYSYLEWRKDPDRSRPGTRISNEG
ncbi:MAG: SdpI family protein [Thermomicrobiales bacterium]|nr:SdpI family protein [Thermomicrobiales bacterium]